FGFLQSLCAKHSTHRPIVGEPVALSQWVRPSRPSHALSSLHGTHTSFAQWASFGSLQSLSSTHGTQLCLASSQTMPCAWHCLSLTQATQAWLPSLSQCRL